MFQYGGAMISDAEFVFFEDHIFESSPEDDYVWEKWECSFEDELAEDSDLISEILSWCDHAALLDMENDLADLHANHFGMEVPAWGKWICPLCGDINEDPDSISQTQCCNGHTVFLRSTDAYGQREAFLSMLP